MDANTEMVNNAANLANRVRSLRRSIPDDGVQAEIDEIAKAVSGLALYVAERDGLRLPQP